MMSCLTSQRGASSSTESTVTWARSRSRAPLIRTPKFRSACNCGVTARKPYMEGVGEGSGVSYAGLVPSAGHSLHPVLARLFHTPVWLKTM